jgi:putative resolvase
VNLTEWAHAQGIHVQTAYRWYREGTLLVPVQRAGRLILVSPQAAAGAARKADGAGLYARVSSHGQRSGMDGQLARLSAWAAEAGLSVVRVEAEVGPGVNGSRAKVRRLLSDPAVNVVVGVLAWLCARLYGRRSVRSRALRALGCARQDIGSQAVRLGACGGAV